MDILAVSGLVLVCAGVGCFLSGHSPQFRVFAAAAGALLLFIKALSVISSVSAQIQALFDESSIDTRYVGILFKGLGICLVTDFICDICTDSGEKALSGQMLLAGKISLLILALPLYKALIELVKTLLI